MSIANPSPFAFNGLILRREAPPQDVMVELTIDESGTVSDYSIPSGKLSNDEMRDVRNFLLFTSFKAATAFGRPVPSKMLPNIVLGPQSDSHNNVGS